MIHTYFGGQALRKFLVELITKGKSESRKENLVLKKKLIRDFNQLIVA